MNRSRTPESALCQFQYRTGRKCRLARHHSHPSLCLDHATKEEKRLAPGLIAAELASLSGGFQTATDLNHVLGKLFSLLVSDRISLRKAAALAYVAQLLLQTLSSVQHEHRLVHSDFRVWEEILRRAFPQS